MIERWFPCKEVSENSDSGWGSGNQEKGLFTWFAARPSAQAKAAVICSLLPWPNDETEQSRLQDLVREAMTGRYAAWQELRTEIGRAHPLGASVLDPFSGRGMIPLEAARLGLDSYSIDYSPVAVLASRLLVTYPFMEWLNEPALPLGSPSDTLVTAENRLITDTEAVLGEIAARFEADMGVYYPEVGGRRPWGYLWAVTLPCQECGHRFPLVTSLELRRASTRKGKGTSIPVVDPGQSFRVVADPASGLFRIEVDDHEATGSPTFASPLGPDGKKVKGKAAICPFCGHSHALAVHQRLAQERLGEDALLLVVEHDDVFGRHFRLPTGDETAVLPGATAALATEPPFGRLLPAVPNEVIPENNGATIRPQLYGASDYGDLMVDRQTLSYVRLSRILNDLAQELVGAGLSTEYVASLMGYASSTMVRMLKFSTRGAKLRTTLGAGLVDHIYANEGTISFSYDFFEVGLSDGPGSWLMMAKGTMATLRGLAPSQPGRASVVERGTASSVPLRSGVISAAVTDPPYDAMVYYADSSDFFYVWLKRALFNSWPELAAVADARGTQDKTHEAIVKEHGRAEGEHRDRDHYDKSVRAAFSEMRRVIEPEGVVTIVFGHGEPDVWQRLLATMSDAGLVMTGSWPATTEAGGQQGKANIRTTLTMACRPASDNRPTGRKGTVEASIKEEVKSRYPDWERWGLAPTDMLMAAAGPAMEIVGQYSEVLDAKGDPVDIATFLPLARAAVQEAMAVEIDHHPLETFDARTRFALWWVRLFGREVAPKSELRWQALAASLELGDVRDLVPDADKGCQFVTSAKFKPSISAESAVIDVALALAAVSDQGREAMGQVLADSGRDPQDAYLWATVKFLADRLPDSDPDSIGFNRVIRAKDGIASAAEAIEVAVIASEREQEKQDKQEKLF